MFYEFTVICLLRVCISYLKHSTVYVFNVNVKNLAFNTSIISTSIMFSIENLMKAERKHVHGR